MRSSRIMVIAALILVITIAMAAQQSGTLSNGDASAIQVSSQAMAGFWNAISNATGAILKLQQQSAQLQQQVTQLQNGFFVGPLQLTFPTTTVGTSAASQNIALVNLSAGNQSASSPRSITGPFSVTAGGCSVVTMGSTCTLSVTFTPTASGPSTGTLTLTYPIGTFVVSLSGNGQ